MALDGWLRHQPVAWPPPSGTALDGVISALEAAGVARPVADHTAARLGRGHRARQGRFHHRDSPRHPILDGALATWAIFYTLLPSPSLAALRTSSESGPDRWKEFPMQGRLLRRQDGIIGGVCGGFASSWRQPVVVPRVVPFSAAARWPARVPPLCRSLDCHAQGRPLALIVEAQGGLLALAWGPSVALADDLQSRPLFISKAHRRREDRGH